MRLRSIVLVPVAAVAVYACSDDDAASGPPAGYEDVLLEGSVTDETLVAFTEALGQRAPAEVPSQMAVFDWPANGEKLPRNPPRPFCWHFGASAQRASSVEGERWAGLLPGSPAGSAVAHERFVSPLRELFGAPRQAFAHGNAGGDPRSGSSSDWDMHLAP
jgi:hypothetical protein